MGNSASTPNGQRLQTRRTQSPSPAPGAPHRSLRSRKKSLELPDLANLVISSSSASTQPLPPLPRPLPLSNTPTPSIPIPNSPAVAKRNDRGRPPPTDVSTTDLLAQTATNNQPFPPRGTPHYRQQQQQQRIQAQQQRMQEIYNETQQAASPQTPQPSSSMASAYHQEIVRSSIPVALEPKSRRSPYGKPNPVPTRIVWRGGGYHVVLARAGDDEWKGRRVMERESPGSAVFQTVVELLPGTHHIRFLVDDQWRVADDLPTAVDDQGSLANYVAVPFGPPKTKDPSFFVETTPPSPQPTRNMRDVPNPGTQEQWTNVLPPELLDAFKEEETYLAHQGQMDPQNHHHRVTGFLPAPNIPPAPTLPRHLDKLILNMRVSPGPAANALGNNVAPIGNAASVVQSSTGSVGSGQGASGTTPRARRDRPRAEERRRGRERGYSDATGSRRSMVLPPPPPPTEIGEFGSPSNVDAILADPIPTTVNSPPLLEVTSASPSGSGRRNPDVTINTEAALSSAIQSGATTPTSGLTPVSSPPLLPSAPAEVSSRTIQIDTANMPPLTDDASVLPVPSHVVLHHLCTSAIKNGVLAVASTTRYRKKYLTTIYYKPT